ncbi:hypothetical protein GCM10010294_51090 [Streptomyces griseoloalbus]|nr:hypothetical protein GCM10010294_51090 [Streptomyces griseoloalbus]
MRKAVAGGEPLTYSELNHELDAGDYPLIATPELTDRLVEVYRATQPDVVLTHPVEDPYNGDHPAAHRMALEARVLAQAIGYPGEGEIIGAPPVFYFEPHQPEMCGFKPEVLLDITEVYRCLRAARRRAGVSAPRAHRPGRRTAPGHAGRRRGSSSR